MKQIQSAIFLIAMLLGPISAYSAGSSSFEELDKPPEGAHRGQILLGAFATIGVPYGKIIGAESDFVRNSTYTFWNNFITKKIMVHHLSFSYGLLCEYMPVDHLGIKFKVRKLSVVQRTLFGAQYQNWSRLTYSDYSFYLGPSVHVTSRRQWDISLTPLIGYAIAEYAATPIAARLIYNYAGLRKQAVNNLALGADINLLLYFSGGLFISFGSEWIMNMLNFGRKYYLNNPMNYMWFFPNKKSSSIHTISFLFSAGYAFSN